MLKKILAISLVLLYATSVYAGGQKRGEAGFMFLKVPIGAREVSMGSTGLTSTTGANAIYWNPANVSAVDRPTISLSYLNHFAGISSNYLAVAFPMSDVGSFGVTFNYLGYGDIQKTTELQPDGGIGSYAPYDLAVGLTYSKQVTDRVSGGLTVKYLSQKIDLVQASGVSFDFGFTYNTDFRGLKLGFVASNLGTESSFDGDGLVRESTDPVTGDIQFRKFGSEPFEAPAAVAFGASMELYRNEQNSITGSAEQNVNSFQANRSNFGIEYGYNNMFFARTGYTSTFQEGKDVKTGKSMYAGMTFGLGLDYKLTDNLGATVDYGYLDVGQLGATHRMTIGVKF